MYVETHKIRKPQNLYLNIVVKSFFLLQPKGDTYPQNLQAPTSRSTNSLIFTVSNLKEAPIP